MKFSELIDSCVECIKGFNPIIKTIDSHADDFLANYKDPYEKVFIKQVFYGCVRYQEFLKVFNTILFRKFSSSTNRNDNVLYQIFGYLTFFRLEELALEDYRRLVLSQDPVKMNTFLQFLFNAEALRENVREEWMNIYDYAYIDEKIIGMVEKNFPNVADILRTVEKRATGKATSTAALSATGGFSGGNGGDQTNFAETGGLSQSLGSIKPQTPGPDDDERPKKAPTQPKPFNLTKPKPKVIPPPEAMAREVKSNPVPKNLFKKSLAEIEQEKEERRKREQEAIRKGYQDSDKQKFQLETEKRRPDKFEKAKIEVIRRRDEELKFDQKYAREVPDFSKVEAPVKLTSAAVLREGHQLKVKAEQDAKILKDFEINMRDASEFDRWKREMEEKEDIERLEHIQKKKIEMELARDAAIEAQKQKERENQLLVQKIKAEMDIKLAEKEVKVKEDWAKKKEVVETVQAQKDNAAREIEKVKEENRRIRDEINKELSEAMQRRKEEEEVEQRKRDELIRQIRELERIPIVRTKGFDPTETSGLGLLDEMSIAELRERLEFNKMLREQEVQAKREENLRAKEEGVKKLMEEAAKIQEARELRREAKEEERDQKKREKEERERKIKAAKDKGLVEVYEKINKKKKDKQAEEERLAKELKEIKLQRQYLNANAAMVEEMRYKELEAGAERKVRNNQNEKLVDQCKLGSIKVKDETIRAGNARTSVLEKLEYDRGYAERLETQKRENEVIHKGVLEYKSEMHERQAKFAEQAKVNKTKRNPFNAKINEQSMQNATRAKERKERRLYEDQNYDDNMAGMLEDEFGGGNGDIMDKLNAE